MHNLKVRHFITGCFLLAISIISIVFFFAFKKTSYHGGFQRNFQSDFLSDRRIADIGFNSYYIAGLTRSRIYLGNVTAPAHLLSLSHSLDNTDTLRLAFPKGPKLARPKLRIYVDSVNIYGWENVTPSILTGRMADRSFEYRTLEPKHLFSAPVILSPATLVAKSYDSLVRRSVFSKIRLDGSAGDRKADVLETQIDGYFCTDGFLMGDLKNLRMAYIYYYRNQFVCLDSNLNLLYSSNTIDTVSTAHIKVSGLAADNSQRLSSPPMMVNRKGAMSSEWIFIQSGLKSDGEDLEQFDSSSVIDVYSAVKGKYLFSFYIPDINGQKILYFNFNERTLFVIIDHYLVTYRIKHPQVIADSPLRK